MVEPPIACRTGMHSADVYCQDPYAQGLSVPVVTEPMGNHGYFEIFCEDDLGMKSAPMKFIYRADMCSDPSNFVSSCSDSNGGLTEIFTCPGAHITPTYGYVQGSWNLLEEGGKFTMHCLREADWDHVNGQLTGSLSGPYTFTFKSGPTPFGYFEPLGAPGRPPYIPPEQEPPPSEPLSSPGPLPESGELSGMSLSGPAPYEFPMEPEPPMPEPPESDQPVYELPVEPEPPAPEQPYEFVPLDESPLRDLIRDEPPSDEPAVYEPAISKHSVELEQLVQVQQVSSGVPFHGQPIPLPEPPSGLLLITGLIGLAALTKLRRRRR